MHTFVADQELDGGANSVSAHIKGACLQHVCVALRVTVLAEDGARGLIEAVRRWRAATALLDPANHAVLLVVTGGVACFRVEVGVPPGNKIELHGVEHAWNAQSFVQRAAHETLALGSLGLSVEGYRDSLGADGEARQSRGGQHRGGRRFCR